jgi:hypothetical protein
LDVVAEPQTFAQQFANGYLFGLLLEKFDLQHDFKSFSKSL